jgi:Tol biopolymer transport system component
MSLDGTGQRNVTNGEIGGEIRGVSWLANGSGFVIVAAIADVAGGNAQLYTLNEDGSGLTRVSTDDDMVFVHVRVNPQGGVTGYAASAGVDEDSLDIHILDSSGQLRATVPAGTFRSTAEFQVPGVTEDFPTYEDNGRALLFETNVHGNWEIYRVESDGRDERNITKTEFNERQPAWGGALDGFTFAYTTDVDGNFEIYTMSLDRLTPTRLTNSPGQDMNPTWVKLPPAE